MVDLLQSAGFGLVACIAEWRANIYDLIFLRPGHFQFDSERLPPEADAWLRDNHGLRAHDALRCKVVRNQTFRIAPPAVLVD